MKLPDREEFQRIYGALQDDVSREIYKHRLLYALFHERGEILKIIRNWSNLKVETSPLGDVQGEVLPLEAALEAQTQKVDLNTPKLCFYGAGEGCRTLLQYSGIRVPFVIDSHRTGSLEGCPILSLEDFLKLPDCREYLVMIAVGKENAKREIKASLNCHGSRYVEAYPDGQYFDLPELQLQNERFVDAGAFDGGTTEYFLSRFPGGYSYVFEADPRLSETLRVRLNGRSDVEVFPFGLYDTDGNCAFLSDENMPSSSRVAETGNREIAVRRLDALLGDRPVTFIKMDIEGSELAALRGAERIIREQRPKLAICVYHKPEDMWEIPGLILQYHPDYKLYLRHYSLYNTETVLYAL
ncbi:FkbM family methyltransferase [uncultured Oscillibacter sp.]|uniref:FkbM family methyltransferase n=1 Tax=uncultured Oscillibacter sp. TaxID=876091 RepID=UPI0025D3FA6A|nr:FkbM family methyltransferase [uncultured Oscillibacter sp.]